MTRFNYIGSISEGTLKKEDLIPCFFDYLGYISPTRAIKLRTEFEATNPDWEEDEEFYESNLADDLFNDLIEALEEACPPFVHFGAQDGDGACFGFWPEPYEEIRDFGEDVMSVDSSLATVPEFLVEVNDHGNMTLYRIKLEEIWSVV